MEESGSSTAVPVGPQQQQSTAAQGTDVISQLLSSAHQADEEAYKQTQVAAKLTTQVHGGLGQANVPGSPTDATRYQIDSSPVVGKRNATRKGAVDVAKGVANLLGQVDQAKNAKTTQRLAVNIEGLMSATSSMDQAKEILQSDPNNAAAKNQLAKAQARADEILSDDKVRKQITKAYNINFTDPSKNNTPEHAALKQATDSYSKQFQDQLPTQLQPNQQAVANAQAATAAAKATHDLVNKIVPSLITAQSRENVAATTQQGAAARETQKETFAWTNDRQKAEEGLHKALAVAETNGRNHLKLAAFNQDKEDSRFFAGLDAKMKAAGGDIKSMKTSDLQHALTEADTIEKSDPQSLTNLIAVRDAIQKDQKKYDANDLEQANQAIYYFKQNQKAHNEARTAIQGELNRRLTGGSASSNSTERSDAASAAKSTAASADPDDDSSANDDDSSVNAETKDF